MEEKTEKLSWFKKHKLLCFLLKALIVIIIVDFIYNLTLFPVNLNECYSVEVSGINGNGTATVVLIQDQAYEYFEKKMGNGGCLHGVYAGEVKNNISFNLNKRTGLSNGDVVKLSFDVKDKLLMKFKYGIRIVNRPVQITVKDLPEKLCVDPFNDLNVSIDWVSGYPYVFIKTTHPTEDSFFNELCDGVTLAFYSGYIRANSPIKDLGTFEVECPNGAIKKGEDFTITFHYDEQKAIDGNFTVYPTSKTYTANPDYCYPQNVQEMRVPCTSRIYHLDELWYDGHGLDVFDIFLKEADYRMQTTSDMRNNHYEQLSEHYQNAKFDYELIGYYFFTPKSIESSSIYNHLIIIYKCCDGDTKLYKTFNISNFKLDKDNNFPATMGYLFGYLLKEEDKDINEDFLASWLENFNYETNIPE